MRDPLAPLASAGIALVDLLFPGNIILAEY